MNMKNHLYVWALMMVGLGVSAQYEGRPQCGTDEYVDELVAQNPQLAQSIERKKEAFFEMATETKQKKGSQAIVYTIPVVFHVLYEDESDNIARNQIEDALRILNEDFRKQNPDAGNVRPIFQSRQADCEIEFALAKRDPNGNCTEGINRIQSSLSVDASPRDKVKTLVQWNPDRYLNIWVVRSIAPIGGSGLVLGYANFPWMSSATDGIVIRHDALGLVGTAVYDGRTLTHEVGHYLGLLHTFQSGCNGGDNIADTPPVASASYGCNLNKNSCSNDSPDYPDMIENFMDYSDGECQNTYTTQQKNVMRSTLLSSQYRSMLVSQSNLTTVGVINPPACQPLALFDVVGNYICEGDSVSFIDQTEEGDPDTYQWSFPGGVPSTSADRHPTVYYPVAGIYDVQLTVSNAAGTSTLSKVKAVPVKSTYSYNTEWRESFEAADVPEPSVTVISDDAIAFEISNQGASSGSQSIYLNNYANQQDQTIDEIISPQIQTLFGQNLSFSFDYAFAKRRSDNSDLLSIQVSTDCGATWSTRRVVAGPILATAPDNDAANFIPGSNDWKTLNLSMAQYESQGPILIKFMFRAGGGNNLYIDNINFAADNIGLAENLLAQEVSVFPNPSQGIITIEIPQTNEAVALALYDVYGKQVHHTVLTHSLTTLDNLNLSSGVYMMHFTHKGTTFTKKLIVE